MKVDSRVLHTKRDQRRFFREVTAAGPPVHGDGAVPDRLPSASVLRDELAALLGQPGRAPGRPAPPQETPRHAPLPYVTQSSAVLLSMVMSMPSATKPPAVFSGTDGVAMSSPSGTRVPDQEPNAITQTRRWRPAALAAAVGGGLVLVVIAGLIVGDRLLAPGACLAALTDGIEPRTPLLGA